MWPLRLESFNLFAVPAGTQRYERTKMVLPLRVWLNERSSDAATLAHTLDISPIGGRLGGLRSPVRPGQTITLQRGQRKGQFRVVWSKTLAPSEVQAGIEALDGGRNIWDIEAPQYGAPQPAALDAAEGPPVPDEDEVIEVGSGGESSSVAAYQAPEHSSIHSSAHSHSHSHLHSHSHSHTHSKMRWVAAFGMLLFVCSLGLLIRYEVLTDAKIEPPHIATPGLPTTEEIAAMTPRPIKLVQLAVSDGNSAQRVQVAEAPKGRVEYPVSPEANVKGKVDLKVVIGTDGSVKQVLLVSGRQMLAHAAAQAVKLWHYSEHQRNGEPVEAETSVVVSFLGKDAVSLRFPSANHVMAN